MAETGKVYQVQYPATVSGKVYNVRDVSDESSVSGKVYQVTNIAGGGTTINNQDITVTENGVYTAEEGYTGLGTVDVQVPNPSTGALNIVANGSYDVTEYATAEVNVPNPSTGALSIVANGSYDVTEYATAEVNVPNPSTGTLNIVENGSYDVTEYATAEVNVTGGGSTEWQPNPLWPDVEKLVEEDTGTYPLKAGVVLYGAGDVTTFSQHGDNRIGLWSKIITSDGAEYEFEYPDNTSFTHTWDTTKDIDDGTGLPVRYLILLGGHFSSNTVNLFTGAIAGQLYPAYIYIKGSYETSDTNTFSDNPLLQYVKVNGTVTLSSNYGAFKNDVSLVKIPENIVFSLAVTNGVPFSNCPRITDMSSLVLQSDFPSATFNAWDWPGVSVMPDCVLATKPTQLEYIGYDNTDFMSLIKIPDGWDLSQCTNFSRTFVSVPNLAYAGTVDMSANTKTFANTRSAFNAPKLREIKCTLPSNTDVWFDASTAISIESFRFMADHAPDVTATPRTLTVGSTNISRINAADPTIITDLNAKGWTVA